MSNDIHGFDYEVGRPARLPRREWRQRVKAALGAGGRRIVHDGETLVMKRDPDGRLVLAFEVYDNIPA